MTVLILAHPSMYNLAQDIAKRAADGDGPKIVFEELVEWDRFADGFPRLFIKKVECLKQLDVVFLASFHTPDNIFEQIAILHSIPRYLARSLTVVLSYFPCSTMERVECEGEIATAMSVARLLSSIPMTKGGPAEIVVFDIHALQERFYFADTVIPRMETAVPLLFPHIENLRSKGPISIVFPDDGAKKRFARTVEPILRSPHDELVVCAKTREADGRRIVRVREGDPKDRHAIIIDDLVMTGGTLLECASCLRSMGAMNVSAYVTHAVFPRMSWKRFTESTLIDNFWITDSLPQARTICENRPFQLISLAEKIIEVVKEDVHRS